MALPCAGEQGKMHANATAETGEVEQFVLLTLDDVLAGAPLPSSCTYTLSGLHTMSPILTLSNGMKLIGQYEETVGTCIIFSEQEEECREVLGSSIHQAQEGPMDLTKKGKNKRIESVCKTEKILKFRLLDKETELLIDKQAISMTKSEKSKKNVVQA